MMETFHLLVPVTRLAVAKSRLAASVSPRDRADLVISMLRQVLRAAQQAPSIGRVSVVSADPQIADEAARAGAAMIGDAAHDLNDALRPAIATVGATALAIVHADLPWLNAAALERLLNAVDEDGIVLAADQHGRGTTAIAWRGTGLRRTAFGPGSLRAHLRLAATANLRCRVLISDPAFRDVDEPEDFKRMAADIGMEKAVC